MRVTFSDGLMKHITAKEGTYNIILHATDVRNRTNEGVLSISASDAVVLTKEVAEGDIWTSKAVLRGGLMKRNIRSLDIPLPDNRLIRLEGSGSCVER